MPWIGRRTLPQEAERGLRPVSCTGNRRTLAGQWLALRLAASVIIACAAGSSGAALASRPTGVADGLCTGVGVLWYAPMYALTGGRPGGYSASEFAADRRRCLVLLAHIGAGSLAAVLETVPPNSSPVFGAGSVDRFFRDTLRSRSKRENLFSRPGGELYSSAADAALVLATAYLVGGIDAYRDTLSRALPLLAFGTFGNNLPTTVFKKAFGRKRPFLRFRNPRFEGDFTTENARESFYSGHTATAFFSAAFSDRLLADLVRRRYAGWSMVDPDANFLGRVGRLAQGVILYGLAGYVGYSRIEIDKHFATDVAAGAVMGSLVGQLTYTFGGLGDAEAERSLTVHASPRAVGVTLRF